MRVLVVSYNAGNIHSIQNALRHIGADTVLTSNIADFQHARIVVFPGVGNAASAMADLKRRGLNSALGDFVDRGGFLLGICVGAQLLFEHSEEENTQSLGLMPGSVRRLPNRDWRNYANTLSSDTANKLKVPHIGWNYCSYRRGNPLFHAIPQHSAFYFVHSYYCAPRNPLHTVASSYYGTHFSSVVQHNRIFGVQFHPEKSGRWGLQLLRNFVRHSHRTIYQERQRKFAQSTFSLQSNRHRFDASSESGRDAATVDYPDVSLPQCANAKVRRMTSRPQRVNHRHRYLLTGPWYDAIYRSISQSVDKRPADPNLQ